MQSSEPDCCNILYFDHSLQSFQLSVLFPVNVHFDHIISFFCLLTSLHFPLVLQLPGSDSFPSPLRLKVHYWNYFFTIAINSAETCSFLLIFFIVLQSWPKLATWRLYSYSWAAESAGGNPTTVHLEARMSLTFRHPDRSSGLPLPLRAVPVCYFSF